MFGRGSGGPEGHRFEIGQLEGFSCRHERAATSIARTSSKRLVVEEPVTWSLNEVSQPVCYQRPCHMQVSKYRFSLLYYGARIRHAIRNKYVAEGQMVWVDCNYVVLVSRKLIIGFLVC